MWSVRWYGLAQCLLHECLEALERLDWWAHEQMMFTMVYNYRANDVVEL